MTWDPEFLDLMPATVNFQPKTGNDRYGKKTYGPSQPARARIRADVHEVIDVEGETRTASGYLWCPPPAFWAPPVVALPNTDCRLVLPNGTVAKVYLVEQVPDEDGLHHLKVHYG